jgi:hypothetical protein
MSISIRHQDREFEVRLDRRRYGQAFYTWAQVLHNGEWLTLGDPWPCSNPKRSEILAAAIYYTRIADLKATGLSVTEASSIAGAEIMKEVQQHTQTTNM